MSLRVCEGFERADGWRSDSDGTLRSSPEKATRQRSVGSKSPLQPHVLTQQGSQALPSQADAEVQYPDMDAVSASLQVLP
jgi:hypothetical protein